MTNWIRIYEQACKDAKRARDERIRASGRRHHVLLTEVTDRIREAAREERDRAGGNENGAAVLRFSHAIARLPKTRAESIASSLEEHRLEGIEACREEARAIARAAEAPDTT